MLWEADLKSVESALMKLNVVLGPFSVILPPETYEEVRAGIEKRLGVSTNDIAVQGMRGMVRILRDGGKPEGEYLRKQDPNCFTCRWEKQSQLKYPCSECDVESKEKCLWEKKK